MQSGVIAIDLFLNGKHLALHIFYIAWGSV